jgi:dTDP-glucose 4,6-dehydratase
MEYMVDLNNKNILVTGGCGFIGSNFIEYLFKNYKNITVVNIDKHGVGSRSMDHMYEKFESNNKYHEIQGDLVDLHIYPHHVWKSLK